MMIPFLSFLKKKEPKDEAFIKYQERLKQRIAEIEESEKLYLQKLESHVEELECKIDIITRENRDLIKGNDMETLVKHILNRWDHDITPETENNIVIGILRFIENDKTQVIINNRCDSIPTLSFGYKKHKIHDCRFAEGCGFTIDFKHDYLMVTDHYPNGDFLFKIEKNKNFKKLFDVCQTIIKGYDYFTVPDIQKHIEELLEGVESGDT